MLTPRQNTDLPVGALLPKLPGLGQLNSQSPKDTTPAPPSPAPSTTSEPARQAYYSLADSVTDPLRMVQESEIVLDEAFVRRISAAAVAEALNKARTQFAGVENAARYAQIVKLKNQPPPPRTAKQVRDHVLANAHLLDDKIAQRTARGEVGYEVDPAVEPLFRLLCLYFARDKRFETEDKTGKRRLDKGLLLTGNVGAGKTTLLRIFRQANVGAGMSFHEASFEELDQAFTNEEKEKGGAKALAKYSNRPYFIDDIGREPGESGHFAERKNVVEVVLEMRNQKCKPMHEFHATTNLSELNIYQKYGKRVYSRFIENFNFLAFPADAKDRRTGQNPNEFEAHIAALMAQENQPNNSQ